MKNFLIFFLLLLGSITAYGKDIPSVSFVETLIKTEQYGEAEKQLLLVQKEYPNSEKVNYYLSQIYSKKQDKLNSALYQSKYESLVNQRVKIQKENSRKLFYNFIFSIIALIIIIGTFYFIYLKFKKKQKQDLLNDNLFQLLSDTLNLKSEIDDCKLLISSATLISLGYPSNVLETISQELADAIEVYNKEQATSRIIEYGHSLYQHHFQVLNKLQREFKNL